MLHHIPALQLLFAGGKSSARLDTAKVCRVALIDGASWPFPTAASDGAAFIFAWSKAIKC